MERTKNSHLSISAGGRDRTQEMLEHMAKKQLYEALMADVTNEINFDMTTRISEAANERGAGVLSIPKLALLAGCSFDAIAVAMPRVRLHHPGNTTVN